jgi:hypothetical protein
MLFLPNDYFAPRVLYKKDFFREHKGRIEKNVEVGEIVFETSYTVSCYFALRNEQFGSKTFDVEPEPILRP